MYGLTQRHPDWGSISRVLLVCVLLYNGFFVCPGNSGCVLRVWVRYHHDDIAVAGYEVGSVDVDAFRGRQVREFGLV